MQWPYSFTTLESGTQSYHVTLTHWIMPFSLWDMTQRMASSRRNHTGSSKTGTHYIIACYNIFEVKEIILWCYISSWGKKWGESGYFRLIRGRDKCGVLQQVTSAVLEWSQWAYNGHNNSKLNVSKNAQINSNKLWNYNCHYERSMVKMVMVGCLQVTFSGFHKLCGQRASVTEGRRHKHPLI